MKQFGEFLKESYLAKNAASELSKAYSALVAHREVPEANREADHHVREKELETAYEKAKSYHSHATR
jgi:hypothetical protein